MGTVYRKSFTPYLELFEPRSAYVSELKLQHAWKNALWRISRLDTRGNAIKILSPGRHNHSDGPDFIGASLILDGKLISGDIEIHHKQQDWYGHGHHLDPIYDECVLHLVFKDPSGSAEARCRNGKTPHTCFISIEEALDCEEPSSCRIFKPDSEKYFNILKKAGWERVRKKIRYFYENRLRFPNDVMLYWGLFKACGYRYNEENMIKLFVSFPWAAYYDNLLDRKDILPMLNELAGFTGGGAENKIRWTRSRTRPSHFPENRIDWLGRLMAHYAGASLSGMIYDMFRDGKNISNIISELFLVPAGNTPGDALKKEMLMNTILPLIEAIRMDRNEKNEIKKSIYSVFESMQISTVYGTVQRFHDNHGIPDREKRQRNWLISQGVLSIRETYCSQDGQLKCPICLLDPVADKDAGK